MENFDKESLKQNRETEVLDNSPILSEEEKEKLRTAIQKETDRTKLDEFHKLKGRN